jgi:hypothetical protein
VCGAAVPDDPPCFQLDNEKHIERKKAEGGNGEEVTGKEGRPVSAEELFPGQVRFQIACFAGTL